jgi:hypothetical protein
MNRKDAEYYSVDSQTRNSFRGRKILVATESGEPMASLLHFEMKPIGSLNDERPSDLAQAYIEKEPIVTGGQIEKDTGSPDEHRWVSTGRNISYVRSYLSEDQFRSLRLAAE